MDVDGNWRLMALEVEGAVVDLGATDISLEVADDRVAGRGGVNRFMGSVVQGADEGALTLSPLASTLMAGPAAAMAVESAYLQVLGAATSAEHGDDRLVLRGPAGSATFRASTGAEVWVDAHPGWRLDDGALVAERTFADFVEAMAFVNRVADAAEDAGHHPDLTISWNRVTLTLRTHDADGAVTDKDLSLAATIDGL